MITSISGIATGQEITVPGPWVKLEFSTDYITEKQGFVLNYQVNFGEELSPGGITGIIIAAVAVVVIGVVAFILHNRKYNKPIPSDIWPEEDDEIWNRKIQMPSIPREGNSTSKFIFHG